MSTLESVVLPLEQCKALVEHGVVLDTAICWYIAKPDGAHETCVWVKTPGSQDDETPAPTLSELLDAIRTEHPNVVFEIYDTFHGTRGIQAWMNDDVDEVDAEGDTDLLAAYALLLEVSK